MTASAAGVERCFGQVSDQKMTDEAIMQRVKTDHQCSVLRAVLHEAVPNGVAHATLRRDTLIKEGKQCSANFEINQQYNLLDKNDGYALPTLKVCQNSYMPPDAAENMFNITGGAARIKDSTYGQGQNVLAFTMSDDVVNEVHSYDARTKEGTTTIFCKMKQARSGQLTPDHKHITVPWFVDECDEVVFLHPGGEDHPDVDALLEAQFKLFLRHTIHVVRKPSGAFHASETQKRIQEVVLPDVISRAKSTWSESQVVMYFTGPSWVNDPPFQKREEGVNSTGNPMYDIFCREPGSSQGESLAKGLITEWANMGISTTQLPNDETICYHKGFQVCNEDIELLCERNKYNDWVAKVLEMGLRAGASFPTEKYSCADFTEGKSALFRFRLHPDAEPAVHDYTKNIPPSTYELRNAHTDEELGFIKKSGGFATYLSRMHGSDQQLSDGELLNLEHFKNIAGTPRASDLAGGVASTGGGTGKSVRQYVVDFGVWLGCNPDLHGNFNEEDEQIIDELFGEGRAGMGLSVLYAFTQKDDDCLHKGQKKGVSGGLKSAGITDYFAKLYGYDLLCSVEHDLRMTPSKTQVADAGDSHRLLTLRRRSGVDYVLQHDPRFAKLREKMKDPTWVPVLYDNNKRDGKLAGAAGPRRTIGAPLTDKQKSALRERIKRPQAVRDKHREQNQKRVEENQAAAPGNIYKYMVKYGCRLAGVETYDELNQMKLSPSSFLYKIRNLLRHKNGVAMLSTLATTHHAIRHPQLAMHQLLTVADNFDRPDTMKDLPPAVEERMRFLEAAATIQAECCKAQLQGSGDKNVSGFKTSDPKANSSSANKKQKTGAGEAGPSGTRKTIRVVQMDSDDDEELEVVTGSVVANEPEELKELRPDSPTWGDKLVGGPKRFKRVRPKKGKFANQNQEPGESSGSERSGEEDSGYESENL